MWLKGADRWLLHSASPSSFYLFSFREILDQLLLWIDAALGMRKGFCTLWNIKCSLSFIDSEFAGFLCSFSRFYQAFIKFSNRAKSPNERQGISGFIYAPERFTSDRWKMTPETSSEQKTRVRVFRNGTRQLTRTAMEQFHFAGLFFATIVIRAIKLVPAFKK